MSRNSSQRAPVLPSMVDAAEIDRLSPQELFDRYFKGTWRARWWRKLIGVDLADHLVKIDNYSTGHVTGELREVRGTMENGERLTFNVAGRRDILGWRRVDG